MHIINTAAIRNNDNRIEFKHFGVPEIDILNELLVIVILTVQQIVDSVSTGIHTPLETFDISALQNNLRDEYNVNRISTNDACVRR